MWLLTGCVFTIAIAIAAGLALTGHGSDAPWTRLPREEEW